MTEQDDKNEVQYGDDEKESSLFRFMSALVVLVAVAGFFGLAWYAYKSGNEVTDEKDVELVKADSTPVKETPANPGGMDIPNQDKTVYGLVNGNKGEKPPVERILPAPEEPVAHGGDTETWMSDKAKKIANGEDGQDTSKQAPVNEPAAAPAVDAKVAAQPDVKKTEQFNPDKAHVQAEESKVQQQAAVPVTPPTPAPVVAAPTPSPVAPTVVADAAPQVTATPVAPKAPAPKAPEVKKPAPVVAPAPAADDDADNSDDEAAAAPATKAATTLPKGPRVQLGAYKSDAEANQNWAKIAKNFASDVQGKEHYVVRADLGDKGVFYRLQAGPFASSKEAEEFCINFVSAGQGCFLAKGK